jgi:hypothetical protein
MTVQRVVREWGDELTVRYPGGPQLRVAYVQEPSVPQEAGEISEGTPHAADMSRCEVRFEILIDDLDAVLDETNTLIETQLTLQTATGGFMFNTWGGQVVGPASDAV